MKRWKKGLLILAAISLAILLVSCGDNSSNTPPEGELPAAASSVELATPSGPILGVSLDGLSIYKGIPYAEPPERFAPPQTVIPWTETLDCTEFGPTAIQARTYEGLEMSEDCLTLNIWTPAQSADEKLPVYIWIHGGGFAQGAGSEPTYDGSNFAKDGIVFVSINYRLNALGFLATQETFNQYGTTGNWGILDQIKALEWVQQNISAFGGDPGNVTVGGESAGSYSTSMLIQSPLAEGLFQRAIMESGSILGVPGNSQYAKGNLERSIAMGQELAFTFNAKDDQEGLGRLRAADAKIFMQMSPLHMDFTMIPSFMMTPVFDGHVVPEDIYGELTAGNINNVDLLWGFNADEGSVFIPGDKNEEQYQMLISKMFGYDNLDAVLERFPVNDQNSATARCREILAHGMFSSVMKTYGDALANNGNQVYAYYFSYVSPANAENGMGAHHGSEIAYAFGNLPPDATPEQRALSDELHARWVNFIKTGDPNNGELPTEIEWPQYDPLSANVLIFDQKVTSGEMPLKADIEFMEGIMFGETGYYFERQQ